MTHVKNTAAGLASLGRGDDKMLVHMTPGEVRGLQQLALAHGGSLTINPKTGLPEAGFLKNILPVLAGAAAVYFTGGAGLAGLGAGGTGALAGAATGALTNKDNRLQGALMGGLGGYTGAGVAGAGMQAFGSGAASGASSGAMSMPTASAGFTPGADSVSAALGESSMLQSVPGQQVMQPVTSPTFTEALGKQFPSAGGKVAAGLGALGAVGAFDQPKLKFAPSTTPTSTAKLSGPIRRAYDPNAPEGYYFTDRGILQPTYAAAGGVIENETEDISGMAVGGIASFKRGQYLDGPGDGMSDSIPATIGAKQPARLADGEFVIPADVVSHIGNGSSKAGAKRLYTMMDRVRQARTGSKKQGKEINPNKFMPA